MTHSIEQDTEKVALTTRYEAYVTHNDCYANMKTYDHNA